MSAPAPLEPDEDLASSEGDGSEAVSDAAEVSGIQLDIYGMVKANLKPADPGEPDPESGADVWRSVKASFRRIAVDVVGLLADTIHGVRNLVRGLCGIPPASADKIKLAHHETDRAEGERQEAASSGKLPAPSHGDADERLESILLALAADGACVRILVGPDGTPGIVICKPEDRDRAAELASAALLKQGVLEGPNPGPIEEIARPGKETTMKQAFTIQYVRPGGDDRWVATAKVSPGFENAQETGVVAFTAGFWVGEPAADRRNANVTVVLDRDPRLLLSRQDWSGAASEAMDLADERLRQEHPGAEIERDLDEVEGA